MLSHSSEPAQPRGIVPLRARLCLSRPPALPVQALDQPLPRSDFGASDGSIGRHRQKQRATASSKRGKDHTSIPKLDQAFSFGQTVVGNDDTDAREGVTRTLGLLAGHSL